MIVVCGCLDVERVNGPGGEPEIPSKNPPHTSVLVREFRVHGYGSAYRCPPKSPNKQHTSINKSRDIQK